MDEYKFRVEFLEDAKQFLDGLDDKVRNKIYYNIWKARITNDKELFKKLQGKIGNLKQSSANRIIAFLLSGTKPTVKIRW